MCEADHCVDVWLDGDLIWIGYVALMATERRGENWISISAPYWFGIDGKEGVLMALLYSKSVLPCFIATCLYQSFHRKLRYVRILAHLLLIWGLCLNLYCI